MKTATSRRDPDWIDRLAIRWARLHVEERMDAALDALLARLARSYTPAPDDGRRQVSPEATVLTSAPSDVVVGAATVIPVDAGHLELAPPEAAAALALPGDTAVEPAPIAAIVENGAAITTPETAMRDLRDPIAMPAEAAGGGAEISDAAMPANPVAGRARRWSLWQASQALFFSQPDSEAERVERKRRKALEGQLLDEAWFYMDRIEAVTARFSHLSYKYKKSERDWMTSGIAVIRFSHAVLTPEALYFRVDTLHMPTNVSVKDLANDETLFNLSMACNHQVLTNVPADGKYESEQGFWYIVERDSGVRGVPVHVRLDEMWAMRPQTADGLAVPVGIGENKRPVWKSLTDMLSMLIAGTPKSGKSNLMNVMLCTWLRFNAPFRLKLALIDLKGGLEFGHYRDVPHLMRYKPLPLQSKEEALEPDWEGDAMASGNAPVDNDGRSAGDPEMAPALVERREDVLPLLRSVYREGRRRLVLLRKAGHRDIAIYNWREPKSRYLPHIVVMVDELAELRMLKPEEYDRVMKLLSSIAQLFRAVGIHLVLATQTPKKEVVNIMTKNSIPTYVAYNCPNSTASQLIIGNARAVGLSPKGRCIFDYDGRQAEVQTPLITDKNIEKVISMAIRNEFDDIELRRHDVTEEEIFKVALEDFNGQLPIEELWKWFNSKQRRIPRNEVRDIIQRRIGQEVSIGSSIYRVKSTPGRKAAALVVVDEQGK